MLAEHGSELLPHVLTDTPTPGIQKLRNRTKLFLTLSESVFFSADSSIFGQSLEMSSFSVSHENRMVKTVLLYLCDEYQHPIRG